MSFGQDPKHSSNKFVNKDYVDNRHNGLRKVIVSDGTVEIRPYPCIYTFEEQTTQINITDTMVLENGTSVKDLIANNCVIFYIKAPCPTTDTLSVRANGELVKWSYPTELSSIVDAATMNGKTDIWIQCYGEYTNGKFTVRCSNALNGRPGIEKVPDPITIVDDIEDGNMNPPTSNAVHDFVVKEIEDAKLQVTEEIIDESSDIPTSNAVYDFVVKQINDYKVETTDEIVDESSDVPTSNAVYDFVDGKFETIDKLFEEWHSDNDYTHIKKNYNEAIGNMTDNLSKGDEASGIIIRLPETSTISEITVGGTNSNGSSASNYQFYGKLHDEITGRVLANCIGSRATISGLTVGVKFDFTKLSQRPYLIKDRDYRLTFHQTETSNTLDKNFYLAYANADLAVNIGKYSPKAIKSDGSIIFPPSKFLPDDGWQESDKRRCTGYKTLIRYESVSNKEFVDVTDEISNIYVAIGETDAASGATIKSLRDDFDNHVNSYDTYASTTDIRLNTLETHKTAYETKVNDLIKECGEEKSKLNQHITSYDVHVNEFKEHNENENIHVTAADKLKWDGMLSNISEGDCISITSNENSRTVSVKTSNEIVNSTDTVPTSSALFNHDSNTVAHLSTEQNDGLFLY